MNETVIRIIGSEIKVEVNENGVTTVKQITPDSLLECITQSIFRGGIHSGLLPRNCLSFAELDSGDREISIIHPEDRADISYFGTEYKNFPLPQLVFGFTVSKEGRVSRSRLGVIANDKILKPNTMMYQYPLSNVSGFSLCIGNNSFPKITSLHTLASLPYLIMAMPNNNDRFDSSKNKPGLEMRDLLELLKDKQQSYYYEHILVPSEATLGSFIGKADKE